MTLPFEDLIDWSNLAIRVDEGLAQQVGRRLLERLPENETEIRNKRKEVCRLNELYSSTHERRGVAMLKSAAAYLQKHGGERPQFRNKLYQHVRECPSRVSKNKTSVGTTTLV